ncbi:MAG: GNAT family N-acetyltransferase [Thermoactinospora sp.]|nr:GNAT family N-acetyltransferase [Thermoactinospora sp.]
MPTLADPLAGPISLTWDKLAGDRFYSTRPWLAYCSETALAPAAAVVVDLPGGGMAGLPVSLAGRNLQPFCDWHTLLQQRGLPLPPRFGLMAGPVLGHQTHLLRTPGVGRKQAAAAVRDSLAGTGLPTIGMFLVTPDAAALREAGAPVTPVLLDADAWLAVPEGGWDEWLAGLSRGRRHAVRQESSRFAEAGYRLREVALGECAEAVAVQMEETEAKYGRTGLLYLETLLSQARHLGDQARVLLCLPPDGPAVGHVLFYVYGYTLYIRSAGFHYARLRGVAEYFNVVIYQMLRRAAAIGARWVHLGTGSSEAKALRGARLRPLWLVDLSPASVLAGLDEQVVAANAATLARLSPTAFVAGQWEMDGEAAAWAGTAPA